MQKWIGCALLLSCAAVPAAGQVISPIAHEEPRLELSAGYTFVRSNGAPGNCGCFLMNGATGSAAFGLTENLSAVADFAIVYDGNVNSGGQRFVLASYLFGPRYSWHNRSPWTPFGEGFAGGAHANGLGYSGSTGPASAFATAVGGGIDLHLSRRIAVRLFEADYYFTHFENGVNSRENNLRLSFGLVWTLGEE